MDVRRLEGLRFEKYVVMVGQGHAGDSYDSPHVSEAFFDTAILGLEIRVLLVLDGSKLTLNQQRFEIGAGGKKFCIFCIASVEGMIVHRYRDR